MVESSAPSIGPAYDAHEAHEEHGNSVAAWVLVSAVMLGVLVMCVAFVMQSIPMWVIGGLLLVGGLVAGRILASMGYGVAGRH